MNSFQSLFSSLMLLTGSLCLTIGQLSVAAPKRLNATASKPLLTLNEQEIIYNSHYFAYERKTGPEPIYHYEIPLQLLESDIAETVPEEMLNSITFTKNGIKYVRWVLHPEDTRARTEIEYWMNDNNLPIVKKQHYTGYQTASRSYLVVDPDTGYEFSIKASTNVIGGKPVSGKIQTWADAKNIRRILDYIEERVALTGDFKHLLILDEPIAFGIGDIKRGIVLRSYSKLFNSKNKYVPAFSILNTEFGAKLAKENGSDNPAEYWNEHLNKPMARAFAELFVKTGLTPDSGHSQNFLLELDEFNRPTGRIVLRDAGDMFLNKDVFDRISKNHPLLKAQETKQVQKAGKVQFKIGLLYRLWFPKWLERFSNEDNLKNYRKWGTEFYSTLETEIFKQTGFSLKNSKPKPVHKMDTFYQGYELRDDTGKIFVDYIANPKSGKNSCRWFYNHAGDN